VQAFVNTVMNFGFYKTNEFLDQVNKYALLKEDPAPRTSLSCFSKPLSLESLMINIWM
jgi:hypothetical protein